MNTNYSLDKIDQIWSALRNGRLEAATLTYKNYIESNKMGKEALKMASQYGDKKLISFLHSFVKDDFDKDYCIICCASNGNLQGLKYFEIAKERKRIIEIAFNKSCRYGRMKVFKYLIKLGVDIRNDNDYGIKQATLHQHYKIVRYFIKNLKVCANIHDNLLIKYACFNQNYQISNFLIKFGADINACNVNKKMRKFSLSVKNTI